MMLKRATVLILGSLVLNTGAATVRPASAEIATTADEGKKTSTTQNQRGQIARDTPLSVQCWQEGAKIIDESRLYGFSVNTLLDRSALTFKTSKRGEPTMFIVSFKNSLCLIRGPAKR